jgi:inorganic pyrophosphatase
VILPLEPHLDPGNNSPEIVRMIVEIPKDSSNKYEYDWSLGLFRLSRSLYSPIHYPGDYGFIPGTVAEDREPLDILCLVTVPSFTGCLTEVRPVAVLDMLDGRDVDQKILSVPERDPRYETIKALCDLQDHTRREIEHFFLIYKELEGRVMQMRGWGEADQARRIIEEGRSRYLARERPGEAPVLTTGHG